MFKKRRLHTLTSNLFKKLFLVSAPLCFQCSNCLLQREACWFSGIFRQKWGTDIRRQRLRQLKRQPNVA